jgi:hypothetical protein
MERISRAVIVDPGYISGVGHHADVNARLLQALERQGWQAECWGDQVLTARGCRGVFSGCGYEDPRHWADLGGTVHLARRLEGQLLGALKEEEAAGRPSVGSWMVHTSLPFQLLGLARALRQCPAAVVVVSLMFAPGETLDGPGGEAEATSNCRVALGALARAVQAAGHQLRVLLPSQQSLELYGPLLDAAGVPCSGLHPAVVGAGLPALDPLPAGLAATGHRPRILLHWGDLKPGKGRQAALEVTEALVHGKPLPASLQDAEWLFHLHSRERVPEAERALLERAGERVRGFLWLNERLEAERMQALLGSCDGALLAYDPVLYRHRSSGLLWCYGAARLLKGRPAAVAGRSGSWLEREAQDLGLSWRSSVDGQWLETLARVLEQGPGRASWTTYGERMLAEDFADHVARMLQALTGAPDQIPQVR